MDAFFLEALAMFQEEARDGLDRCEERLLALGAGPDPEAVAGLFRDIHTVKGNARVLGFKQLESLAHAAEDLVGQVRDDGRVLEPELVDLLLSTVDVLRQGAEEAVTRQGDVDPDFVAAPMSQLRATIDAFASGDAPTTADGPASAPLPTGLLEAATAAGGIQVVVEERVERTSLGWDELAPAAPALDDARVTFLQWAEGELGTLSLGLRSAEAESDERKRAVELLSSMRAQAESFSFYGLLEAIETVEDRLTEPDVEAIELEEQLFEGLVEVQEMLADELEVEPGVVCDIAYVFQRWHLEQMDQDAKAVLDLLEPEAVALPGLEETARRFGRMFKGLTCLELEDEAGACITASDEVDQLAMLEEPLTTEKREELRGLAQRVLDIHRERDLLGEVERREAEALEQRMSLAPPPPAPIAGAEGFEAHLTPSSREELTSALAAGALAHVVFTAPGIDDTKLAAFMKWAQSAPRKTITSRTELDGDVSHFEFLVASPESPSEVKRALSELDPSGEALQLVGDVPDEAAPLPVAPLAETPLAMALVEAPEIIEMPAAAPASGPRMSVAPEARPSMAPTGRKREAMLKVPLTRVESLLNLAREISLSAGATLRHPSLQGKQDAQLSAQAHRLDALVQELQEAVTLLALVPLSGVFQRMQRAVRDVARASGKQVGVKIEGGDTEIDKSVADRIAEPLLHLVRNAVDHGLEEPDARSAAGKPSEGQVTLRAKSDGSEVHISIIDDGKGLNREKILARAVERGLVTPNEELEDSAVWALIFEPGFSTAAQVTDLSGRGVGMDVVRTEVSRLGGRVVIESEPGQGTEIRLELPLSVAFLDSIIARIDETLYAIPTSRVCRMVEVDEEQTGRIDAERRDYIRFEGEVLTLCDLPRLFDPDNDAQRPVERVVVVENRQQRVGLVVDDLLGHEQVVVKPMATQLRTIPVARACGLLPSGDVALVLDCERLHQAYRG